MLFWHQTTDSTWPTLQLSNWITDSHIRTPTRWRLTYEDAVIIAHPDGLYGELAKVELTHERDAEDGRYTLALSVGDEVVGRVDADIFIADLNLFKMFVGQKTDIKRVVILDKP